MVLLVSDREDLVPAIRVALGEEVDFLRESLREFRWRIHSRDIDTTTAILIDARTMSADLNAAIDDIVPIRRHLYLFGIVPDGEVRLASDLTHRGLDRCVHASIDPRLLREVVIDTLTRYQRACLSIRDVPEIQSTLVGRSRVMQALRDRIRRVARYDDPVMILGESGVGKELVAHAVHTLSPRRDRPYRPVNVTALVDSLFESELFGVRRGAYTGAVESAGIFGDTEDGSVFLDEIGDLSPPLQPKLLRLVEYGTYYRVGESKERRSNARVIAATNRDMSVHLRIGTFREDLWHRLAGMTIHVPPLRHHVDDIEEISYHILKKRGHEAVRIDRGVIRLFQRYPWPGNVRELGAVLARAIANSEGDTIAIDHIELESSVVSGEKSVRSIATDECRRHAKPEPVDLPGLLPN